MKTATDTWLKIQGLKQHKKKPRLFWRVWFGNAAIDEGLYHGILKAKYKGWDVKIKGVY